MDWIPVTKRPPEKSGNYLVTIENCGEKYVDVSLFILCDDGDSYWLDDVVTAWMPRPKPYDSRKERHMVTGVDMKATGKRIKDLCKEKWVTAKDIQDRLGFSTPSAIYKWHYGGSVPCVDNLIVLADMLGVTVDDILVPLIV